MDKRTDWGKMRRGGDTPLQCRIWAEAGSGENDGNAFHCTFLVISFEKNVLKMQLRKLNRFENGHSKQ